jgi:hypothetical protein
VLSSSSTKKVSFSVKEKKDKFFGVLVVFLFDHKAGLGAKFGVLKNGQIGSLIVALKTEGLLSLK